MQSLQTDELGDDRALATQLMDAFGERTGLSSQQPPRRYLWTDAFAVCNFLALARQPQGAAHAALAERLVEQVHQVLGRHRPDDARQGWISGLSEEAGALQPTLGGLRIGKPLPERGRGAPFDADLEWERDGQYFHYLTRWMHALDQFAHAAGRDDAQRWACELAQVAVTRFGLAADIACPRRLAWKMSIDLSRAQVPSSGQHDALDGWITCLQLQARRTSAGGPDLAEAIAGLKAMALSGDWRTDDPLGLGGLLGDAWRLAQLPGATRQHEALLVRLLDDARVGLGAYVRQPTLQRPLSQRLAFRELGLAIGLKAVAHMQAAGAATPYPPAVASRLEALLRFQPVGDAIEAAWRVPAARTVASWRAHEDINAVMLATCLEPSGYLDLA